MLPWPGVSCHSAADVRAAAFSGRCGARIPGCHDRLAGTSIAGVLCALETARHSACALSEQTCHAGVVDSAACMAKGSGTGAHTCRMMTRLLSVRASTHLGLPIVTMRMCMLSGAQVSPTCVQLYMSQVQVSIAGPSLPG